MIILPEGAKNHPGFIAFRAASSGNKENAPLQENQKETVPSGGPKPEPVKVEPQTDASK